MISESYSLKFTASSGTFARTTRPSAEPCQSGAGGLGGGSAAAEAAITGSTHVFQPAKPEDGNRECRGPPSDVQIASTNQHPTSMGATWMVAHGVCGVAYAAKCTRNGPNECRSCRTRNRGPAVDRATTLDVGGAEEHLAVPNRRDEGGMGGGMGVGERVGEEWVKEGEGGWSRVK